MPEHAAMQYVYFFGGIEGSAIFKLGNTEGASILELSVKLNYLATGAVFAFLAAILLGAF